MGLDALPAELVHLVLGHADLADAVAVSRTSRWLGACASPWIRESVEPVARLHCTDPFSAASAVVGAIVTDDAALLARLLAAGAFGVDEPLAIGIVERVVFPRYALFRWLPSDAVGDAEGVRDCVDLADSRRHALAESLLQNLGDALPLTIAAAAGSVRVLRFLRRVGAKPPDAETMAACAHRGPLACLAVVAIDDVEHDDGQQPTYGGLHALVDRGPWCLVRGPYIYPLAAVIAELGAWTPSTAGTPPSPRPPDGPLPFVRLSLLVNPYGPGGFPRRHPLQALCEEGVRALCDSPRVALLRQAALLLGFDVVLSHDEAVSELCRAAASLAAAGYGPDSYADAEPGRPYAAAPAICDIVAVEEARGRRRDGSDRHTPAVVTMAAAGAEEEDRGSNPQRSGHPSAEKRGTKRPRWVIGDGSSSHNHHYAVPISGADSRFARQTDEDHGQGSNDDGDENGCDDDAICRSLFVDTANYHPDEESAGSWSALSPLWWGDPRLRRCVRNRLVRACARFRPHTVEQIVRETAERSGHDPLSAAIVDRIMHAARHGHRPQCRGDTTPLSDRFLR